MDLISTGALALVLAAAPAPAQKGDALRIDTTPQHTFRAPLVNGMGTKSLADLKGKPVLIEFWKMNDDSSVRVAVPAALALSKKYEDSMHVLLVEANKADKKAIEHMALAKKWLGSDAMWTNEPPIVIDPKTDPYFALLDSDGKVILKGDATKLAKQIDDALINEMAKASTGPEDLPRSLKMAWKASSDDQFAKGIAEASAVARKGGDDAKAATDLADGLRKRAAKRITRAKWMMDNGFIMEASDEIAQLTRAVAGDDKLAKEVSELHATLVSDAMKREVAAGKLLASAKKSLYEKGLDATGADSALAKIVKDFAGTKTADQAKHLLEVLRD